MTPRACCRKGLPAALLVLMCAWEARSGAQQIASQMQVETKLGIAVYTPNGKMTVAALLAALSKQTGIAIKAETFLQNRLVVAQLDGLTAAQVLDALCEIQDWRWYQTEKGGVLVTRRRVVMPHDVTELAAAVQSAFPSDFKRYLGILHPVQDAYKLSLVNTSAYRFLPTKEQKRVFKEEIEGIYPPSASRRSDAKLPAMWRQQEKWLFDSVLPTLPIGKELSFSLLTPQQQDALTAALILHDLVRLPAYTLNMLDGSFRADLFDPSVLEIRLQAPNALEIGRTTLEMLDGRMQERFVGGFAVIPELASRPAESNKP